MKDKFDPAILTDIFALFNPNEGRRESELIITEALKDLPLWNDPSLFKASVLFYRAYLCETKEEKAYMELLSDLAMKRKAIIEIELREAKAGEKRG